MGEITYTNILKYQEGEIRFMDCTEDRKQEAGNELRRRPLEAVGTAEVTESRKKKK